MDFNILRELVTDGYLEDILDFLQDFPGDLNDAYNETLRCACKVGWKHIVVHFAEVKGVDASNYQQNFIAACKSGNEGLIQYLFREFHWDQDTYESGLALILENGHAEAFEVFIAEKMVNNFNLIGRQLREKQNPSMFYIFLKHFPERFHLVCEGLETNFIDLLLREGVSEHYFSPKVIDEVNEYREEQMKIVLENV